MAAIVVRIPAQGLAPFEWRGHRFQGGARRGVREARGHPRKAFAAARNLDRKVFDVNEARHINEGRLEDVNDIVTALLREDRLRVTHEGVSGGRKTFILEPYTLLVYKKRLDLAGFSHQHHEIRTFALDGFREVEWLKGDHFDYPADYRPEQLTEGVFGLIRGEPARVRILFDPKTARYVQRRVWHPTQRFRPVDGGVEMSMDVRGTMEIVSWVLGFGATAAILEPASLRESSPRRQNGWLLGTEAPSHLLLLGNGRSGPR